MALEPLSQLRVVDLYAGSGALGIEALSRGAAFVDFVECEPPALKVLRDNLSVLGLVGRARVWGVRLPRGFPKLGAALRAADLVLADPPYGGEAARAALEALGDQRLKPGVRVVVEHHRRDRLPDRCGGLQRMKGRRYGETWVSTYQAAAESRPSASEE